MFRGLNKSLEEMKMVRLKIVLSNMMLKKNTLKTKLLLWVEVRNFFYIELIINYFYQLMNHGRRLIKYTLLLKCNILRRIKIRNWGTCLSI